MNTKDFSFVYRREILILICFLIALTFSQIALEKRVRISSISPIATLKSLLLESLGILLPILISFYLFFSNWAKADFTWLPPRKWIAFSILLFLFLTYFPIPEPIEEELPGNEPENGDETSSNDYEPGKTIVTSLEMTASESTGISQVDSFISPIIDFRDLFLLCLLFLPFLFIILIQKRSRSKEMSSELTEHITDDKQEAQYKVKTILECYYQASTSLEERGADNSPSLTPSEFTEDVSSKELCSPLNIADLTGIFEEAKFSTHKMSTADVEDAKILASKIIFPPDSTLETGTEKENDLEKKG
ncbi:MAG: DUF4129 domain-containing protein [Candidatus Hodarchaeota archaeon]